jgi:hypothetical protein
MNGKNLQRCVICREPVFPSDDHLVSDEKSAPVHEYCYTAKLCTDLRAGNLEKLLQAA